MVDAGPFRRGACVQLRISLQPEGCPTRRWRLPRPARGERNHSNDQHLSRSLALPVNPFFSSRSVRQPLCSVYGTIRTYNPFFPPISAVTYF